MTTLLVTPRDSLAAVLAGRLAGRAWRVAEPQGEEVRYAALGDPPLEVVVYRPPSAAGGGPDLADAAALLAACRRLAPRRLVLLSSAAVSEPRHDHPGLLTEERHRPPRRNRIARRWHELEELAAARLAGSGVRLVVLRPAPVAARDGADPLCRLLARRLAPAVAGHDPSIQLLAPGDLAEAVARAAESATAEGVYHVAPAGTVPLRAALKLAGARRLPLPFSLQLPFRPADELAWCRYPATVASCRVARDLGFVPARSSAQAVAEAFGGTAAGEPGGFDDFGLDPAYLAAYGRTLFRFLHRVWWRVEARGLEHVPRTGRAMLVGVHRGFMPWDGVMALHTVLRETGRTTRFLIHPGLVKFPYLANYLTKIGGIMACRANADRVLAGDGLLGFFPEGIRGAFSLYRDAYKLGRFGRDEFVRMALRNRAPIVPFVTVGSAEIFPILAKIEWPWWRRYTEWPFLPITPTFPLLPVPLPSKWHMLFLEPVPVHERYPPEAAADPEVVRAISAEVRARIEAAQRWMLDRRRRIFWGSIFGEEEAVPAGAGRKEAVR